MLRLVAEVPLMACVLVALGAGDSWEEYRSAEGQYKVSFPGKPKEQKQAGPGFTVKAAVLETPAGAYLVAHMDLPIPEKETPEKITDRLDGAIQNMARSHGGKILKDQKFSFNRRYPGREFQIAVARPVEGRSRGKIFLKGKRLYQVMVLGTEEFTRSEKVGKFLDSFALTD